MQYTIGIVCTGKRKLSVVAYGFLLCGRILLPALSFCSALSVLVASCALPSCATIRYHT